MVALECSVNLPRRHSLSEPVPIVLLPPNFGTAWTWHPPRAPRRSRARRQRPGRSCQSGDQRAPIWHSRVKTVFSTKPPLRSTLADLVSGHPPAPTHTTPGTVAASPPGAASAPAPGTYAPAPPGPARAPAPGAYAAAPHPVPSTSTHPGGPPARWTAVAQFGPTVMAPSTGADAAIAAAHASLRSIRHGPVFLRLSCHGRRMPAHQRLNQESRNRFC